MTKTTQSHTDPSDSAKQLKSIFAAGPNRFVNSLNQRGWAQAFWILSLRY